MSGPPSPEDLAVGSEQAAGFAVQHAGGLGIELDYSVDSVGWVEALLSRMHETLPRPDEPPDSDAPSPEDVNSMISIYGAYVGEVIRRTGGGEWQLQAAPEGGEPGLALVASDGGVCWPTTKVAKRVIQGPEENVFDYVRVLLERHWMKT